MNDQEFLDYCDTHSETHRAGFLPEQIARLLRLAGKSDDAIQWDGMPVQIISCGPDAIQPLTHLARQALAGERE